MGRARFLLSLLLVSTSAILLSLGGCGDGNLPGNQSVSHHTILQGKIQHVVVIFQENRTPDNLFHDPVLIANGADIANSGLNSSGDTIPLLPTSLSGPYDPSHYHHDFVAMYDDGRMDGANKIAVYCWGREPCPPPNPQFTYVQASDVGPYFQMAEQYTFGDRMFQTNEGPSFPAHQFIISGTSAPTATSNMFVSGEGNGDVGCTAAAGARVGVIDSRGNDSISIYPCFEHPTLTDELDAKGVSWRYYTPSVKVWSGLNAIRHICQAQTQNGQSVCTGRAWSNVVTPPKQVLIDIADNELPEVSWVIPSLENSDHAATCTSKGGPSWVAAIVNAIGASSYWSNTAILITWDDWGGWYDHVPPPQVINDGSSWGSGYVYGFRVPLIVVSRYAKAGYISHVTHDFGSILNFIEQVFGLPSLGYADARADDLSDCFSLNQTPLEFQKVEAPLSAQYFLNDNTPPTDPDDDQ